MAIKKPLLIGSRWSPTEKLDLTKPADRLVAQQKAFAEDPDLYERYRTANTVRVGKVL
jgi:hypothetical protein